MPRLIHFLIVTAVLAAGCDAEPSAVELLAPDNPPAPPRTSTAFDPANCGTVAGRVTWSGPLPTVSDFVYGVPKGDGSFDPLMMPNPNRPAVDPASRAVAGAVVFLRGVAPTAAKPWDLPPVRVEMNDRQIVVRQGDGEPRRVGFVRRGDAVSMAAAEPLYHVLRGRGAAFFSFAFPDAGKPLARTFDRSGRVELSSGAGYYWASADLFVDDHPYYAVTDRDGRFTLDRVPAGSVEVVAWLPGWTPGRQERDPETGMFTRMTYSPPVEVIRGVTVERGHSVDVNVSIP